LVFCRAGTTFDLHITFSSKLGTRPKMEKGLIHSIFTEHLTLGSSNPSISDSKVLWNKTPKNNTPVLGGLMILQGLPVCE
jgi:hypothetical protein